MSLLPCRGDLATLGVVEGRYWNLEGLEAHLRACQTCASVYDAMASAMGSHGGTAGRGEKKRRGSSDYYRQLAWQRWNQPTERKGLRTDEENP